ncbi:N-acetylmuramoyl-L-alanine amidase [Serratia marcescens]|uniref:N-acetylmuramoyl-L-alanine amidase n=1 Tax=Serratia TaxID=613 RepID=UPI0018D8F5F3|nr:MULTISPECIES: N-acetylmuramoyl-L-alanine amidase [Serratia]MBH2987641.1 N-acetylmuramoyl-L-alanine amidase [Serratia ureilytica]MBN5396239.1 N-acetylmuramoyl-L-alanine amidase [Serratia ureilytica]MDP8634789.1 N-acetylmuramoyl-L-alanine amidase [Serratia marcescens]MDP8868290.1 N-acetylmuramoyl-L-alanine amidase [Serratia marcescens]
MKIWPGIIAAALLAGCQNPQQDTLVDRGAYQLETLHQAQGADQRIRFLVMHYTAEDFHSSLKTLTDEHVSAHYLLPAHPQREHGKPTVYRLVPEAKRAWHAGASGWRGRSNLNDTSIGIEIVNKGFTRNMLFTHWQPYTAEQIAVLIPLSRDIIQRYGIQPQDVVGHSDIAPQRKQDPGPLFPWRQLAQAGIGAWPDEADVQRLLAGRDRQAPVPLAPLLEKLARYGYAIDPSWDARQQRNVLAAFQMHFRPDDVRGEPDAESEAIIDALLLKYGAWR